MKSKMILLSSAITITMIITSLTVVSASQFNDVADNSAYAQAIEYCKKNGIMNGTSAAEFSPDENITRSMLATILYQYHGSPYLEHNISFDDVDNNSWYYNAVKWADKNNIINGYDTSHFGPNDLLTREQIISILWRISGSPDDGTIIYNNVSDISDYAKTAVLWAFKNNIISIQDSTLNFKEYVTRSEIAVMLYNMLNIEKTSSEMSTEIPLNSNETTPNIHVTFNNSEFDVILYPSLLTNALLNEIPETQMMLPPSYDKDNIYKYYDLPWTLDIVPENITEAKSGDILINDEGRLFLYYKNSILDGNFMQIGYVKNTENLAENLGSGSVNFYVSQYNK